MLLLKVSDFCLTVKTAVGINGLKIVSIEWLRVSIDDNSKADEDSFPVTPAASNPTAMGKKRARSASPIQAYTAQKDGPLAKKPKEGNIAKSRSLRIPLDETCPLAGGFLGFTLSCAWVAYPSDVAWRGIGYRVYIGDDDIIYDAALNQTNAGHNANEFYRIQLLVSSSGSYKTWTRWGRVGEHGANAKLGDGSLGNALGFFNAKFKDKSGLLWQDRLAPTPTHTKKPKYTFIERKYEHHSSDDEGEIMVGHSLGTPNVV